MSENFKQQDLIYALEKEDANICLYRNGQIRLRDKNHNPLRNITPNMFEAVRHLLIRKDGLFYYNKS